MSTEENPRFRAGKNIAMKVPPADFDSTVAFYRDLLGFGVVGEDASGPEYRSVVFEFGTIRLWIDEAKNLDRPEFFLEIECDDEKAAAEYLEKAGIVRRDEVEPLPEGFGGFWIQNPAGVIHLVARA